MAMASALDIIEAGWPPRALFVDYPLGHTVGPPFDPDTQYRIVREGVQCLASITTPEEIRHLDVAWPEGDTWKEADSNPDDGDFRAPRDMERRYQTEEDRVLAEGAAGE
jgi:hypothetical protein